jgi:hypothetical protein
MRAKSCPRRWNVEPSQVPAAPNPPKVVRPRKLQNALNTIAMYGGYQGVTDAARELGVEASNIDWHLREVDRIPCGRMYLKWDAEQAAKARREGKA